MNGFEPSDSETPSRTPRLAGASLVVLGAVVLAGWWTKSYILVQVLPGLVPMPGSVAVSFSILGLCLLGLHQGLRRSVSIAAALVALYALLVFAEYVFEADLGIDQLLFDHPSLVNVSSPERMAPNTSVGLALAGAAMILLSTSRLTFLSAVLGCLVFTLGGIAFLGYLIGLPSALSWGTLPHMALLTSVGHLLCGTALVVSALERHRKQVEGEHWRGPLLVSVTVTVAGLLLWHSLRGQEMDQSRRALEASASNASSEVSRFVDTVVLALSHLAEKGDREQWSSRADWQADAWLSMGAFSGFETIEWIDSKLTPKVIGAAHPQARPLAIEPYGASIEREALELVRATSNPVVVGPLSFENGQLAFKIIVPFRSAGFEAFMAGVISAEDAFSSVLKNAAEGYAIQLRCRNREVFSRSLRENFETDLLSRVPIELPGGFYWEVVASPTPELLAQESSALPEVILGGSLLIAFLLGSTVWFAQREMMRAERFETAVLDRTRELEQAMGELRVENEERRRGQQALKRTQAVSRLLSAKHELTTIVQAVTDAATDLTGARYGAFFCQVDDGGGESHELAAFSGAEPHAFRDAPNLTSTELFGPKPSGDTVISCRDTTEDPRFGPVSAEPPDVSTDATVRSFLAVPVVSRYGHVWGGLFFGHSRRGAFAKREEEIAVGLAAQAAVAMDNARLLQAERDARAIAQSASEAKDRFMFVLSHELRNPLASIRSALEVLRSRRADPEVSERMQEILGRQVLHLTGLVDDLLDVRRIASGNVALDFERLDLVSLVARSVEACRIRTVDKGIEIDSELPNEPAWVDADPKRIAQALDNLLGNAEKFTAAGGRIEVRIVGAGEFVAVSVRDTGCGIDPEEMDHVFEPFAQTTDGKRLGGLGLGLAICKGIVEAHGGSLEVTSAGQGHGAEFSFRLARRPQPAAEEARRPGTQDHPPRKILVIDDHQDSLDGLSQLLQLQGHEVREAHDGLSGLAAFREFPAEVVICDIGLPGIDGYEVVRRLRREHGDATPPVIALSGYGDERSIETAREAGFDHHLTKPVDSTKLLRLVNRACSRRA